MRPKTHIDKTEPDGWIVDGLDVIPVLVEGRGNGEIRVHHFADWEDWYYVADRGAVRTVIRPWPTVPTVYNTEAEANEAVTNIIAACGHGGAHDDFLGSYEAISHDEYQCAKCGNIICIPDMDYDDDTEEAGK